MKMNNDTLTHHGVKGMHRGVRRYQNADGSLTSKGKERYGDTKSGSASKPQATHRPKPVAAPVKRMSDEQLRSANARYGMEKAYKRNLQEAKGKSKLETAQDILNTSEQTVNRISNVHRQTSSAPKYKKMDRSKMTDEEMRKEIKRAQLERQYNQMVGEKEVNKGEKVVQDILDHGGAVLSVASSSLAIAISIQKLLGKL